MFDDNRTVGSGLQGWCSLVFSTSTSPNDPINLAGVGQLLWVTVSGPVAAPILIHDVLSGSAATTVGSIIYDNSTTNTNTCVIQPKKAIRELKPNAVIRLNATSTSNSAWSRVVGVVQGPNETFSVITHTGTASIAAGHTLEVRPCARVEGGIGITPAGGDPVNEDSGLGGTAGAITTTGAGTSSVKTGWLQITPTTAIDITTFTVTGVTFADEAVTDDTYLHFSIRFSDLSKLVQGRLMFDCDTTSLNISSTASNGGLIRVTTPTAHELATGDTVFIDGHNASTNGTWIITRISSTIFDLDGSAFVADAGANGTVKPQFKKNFYYRAFTSNDLLLATKGSDTARSTRTTTVQNQQLTRVRTRRIPMSGEPPQFDEERSPIRGLDPEAPDIDRTPDTQTTTGDFQWSEIIFRRRDLVAVGELAERGRYHSINAVRLELTMTDTTAVWADLNSLTVFGAHEPDVFELGAPYKYRYRYRAATTGARSNWSPDVRSGVAPKRGPVVITATTPSGAPEIDLIDIQRLGGSNTSWLDIATVATSSPTYTDKVSDLFALGSATVAEDDSNFQPWPITDVPFSTTATSVTGCYIITSVALPSNLAKGTPMKVSGIHTSYRRTISAAQRIYEIEDSLGTLTSVTVEIPAPLIQGQALRSMWVHNERSYACGDPKNPGVLYFSNRTNLDGMAEDNKVEVTSPSEPLQNGTSFNGKNYVWSSERMFEIQDFGELVIASDIPGVKGMLASWGLAVGERIWFLAKDGIYQTGGGEAISITDKTLKPLFVKEGNVGVAVNGFNAPDFAQTSRLRLSYYDGYLYFIYQDTAGAMRCLTYNVHSEEPGWWPDVYTGAGGNPNGISYLYGEEGSGVHSLLAGGNNTTNAKLYQVTGTADDTGGIACHLRTPAFDAGDRRANKHWGDFIVDADSQGASITAAIHINNYSTTAAITPTILSTSTSGRTQTIIDTSSGVGFKARNAALDLSWTSTGASPKLFLWEPSSLTLPDSSKLRATYWDDLGYEGDKFIQGIEIRTDTTNIARTVRVEYDGGTLADTLTIQHNGDQTVAYSFRPAFIAHQVRLRSTDANTWETFKYRWIWERESPLGDRWEGQQTSLGADQFLHMKEAYICLRSTMNVTFTVTRTDDNTATNYTIPTTSGLRLKTRVPLTAQVSKGKAFTFVLSSTSTGGTFRLYRDDSYILAKEWASETAFASKAPFGSPHGQGKAEI